MNMASGRVTRVWMSDNPSTLLKRCSLMNSVLMGTATTMPGIILVIRTSTSSGYARDDGSLPSPFLVGVTGATENRPTRVATLALLRKGDMKLYCVSASIKLFRVGCFNMGGG